MDKNLQLLIQGKVIDKSIIFLDTKYWLLIRDSILGNPKSQTILEIQQTIYKLKKANKVICPLDESVFLELMKQKDDSTRLKTAQIMDSLSDGVVMVNSKDRLSSEIKHSIYFHLGKNIEKPQIWTIPFHILGKVSEPNYITSLIQKQPSLKRSLDEKIYSMKIEDMARTQNPNPEDILEQAAKDILRLSRENNDDIISLKRAYDIEYIGLLSEFKDIIYSIAKELPPQLTPPDLSTDDKYLSICNKYPSIHARTLLYAFFRWDKKRKFNDHDIYDRRYHNFCVNGF